ncbi:MAG: hypothetical protein K2X27_12420 [Candidatus Obscuribacterales bacterium]|nr:hypothetical protein [Candidatus Obscuribacterales bacterium]
MKQYRQGDVLLKQISAIPSGALKAPADGDRVVLAYGEVTGHAHAIEAIQATIYKSGAQEFIEVLPGAVLRHEEHAPIPVEPGIYEIVHQREYEPNAFRRVID